MPEIDKMTIKRLRERDRCYETKRSIFFTGNAVSWNFCCGFAYPSNCYAATAETESSSEQSIYSLANHYFKIKSISNGKYLLGNKAGYEAQADTADSGMTFYFKASDLREYILFDQDSKYLTYNTFNAIVRNTTLSDKTRFKVEQYEDNSFLLFLC